MTTSSKINQGTFMEGEITSKNDIRLDGILNGKINTDKKIIIGIHGTFSGKLKCENLIVEGSIKGEATVSNSTSLLARSSFSGILSTQKFNVEEGASFDGDCKTIIKNNPTDTVKALAVTEKIKSTEPTDKSDQKYPIEAEVEALTENTLEKHDNI